MLFRTKLSHLISNKIHLLPVLLLARIYLAPHSNHTYNIAKAPSTTAPTIGALTANPVAAFPFALVVGAELDPAPDPEPPVCDGVFPEPDVLTWATRSVVYVVP
jgi:hypothetical protein